MPNKNKILLKKKISSKKNRIAKWTSFLWKVWNNYGWGVNLTPTPYGFLKHLCYKERVKPWFFVSFNIIIIHIFPENFIEVTQVIHKLWRISLTILAIFIIFNSFLDFWQFLFLISKETNDASLWQVMSTFFHFQHTLNRLFSNSIKLCWY